MVKTSLLAALSAVFLASATAAPNPHCPAPSHNGPKVNVIFFSDSQCKTTVPKTIYTRNVFPGTCTNNFPDQSYSSLIIDHIDDQFIGILAPPSSRVSWLTPAGKNAALIVGNSPNHMCNFTKSVKFSVANRENVGKCQFVGIPQAAPGKPLLAGNEYQLGTLQG